MALSNNAVIEAFKNGKAAHNVNLTSTGDRLINYSTTIAEYVNGTIVLNGTRYSSSTSKVQCYTRRILGTYKEITGVPKNTIDLSKYAK